MDLSLSLASRQPVAWRQAGHRVPNPLSQFNRFDPLKRGLGLGRLHGELQLGFGIHRPIQVGTKHPQPVDGNPENDPTKPWRELLRIAEPIEIQPRAVFRAYTNPSFFKTSGVGPSNFSSATFPT